MGRNARPSIETDAGVEIQCSKCKDWWPRDPEFFFISGDTAHSWCKACYLADPKVLAKKQRCLDKMAAVTRDRQAARRLTQQGVQA